MLNTLSHDSYKRRGRLTLHVLLLSLFCVLAAESASAYNQDALKGELARVLQTDREGKSIDDAAAPSASNEEGLEEQGPQVELIKIPDTLAVKVHALDLTNLEYYDPIFDEIVGAVLGRGDITIDDKNWDTDNGLIQIFTADGYIEVLAGELPTVKLLRSVSTDGKRTVYTREGRTVVKATTHTIGNGTERDIRFPTRGDYVLSAMASQYGKVDHMDRFDVLTNRQTGNDRYVLTSGSDIYALEDIGPIQRIRNALSKGEAVGLVSRDSNYIFASISQGEGSRDYIYRVRDLSSAKSRKLYESSEIAINSIRETNERRTIFHGFDSDNARHLLFVDNTGKEKTWLCRLEQGRFAVKDSGELCVFEEDHQKLQRLYSISSLGIGPIKSVAESGLIVAEGGLAYYDENAGGECKALRGDIGPGPRSIVRVGDQQQTRQTFVADSAGGLYCFDNTTHTITRIAQYTKPVTRERLSHAMSSIQEQPERYIILSNSDGAVMGYNYEDNTAQFLWRGAKANTVTVDMKNPKVWAVGVRHGDGGVYDYTVARPNTPDVSISANKINRQSHGTMVIDTADILWYFSDSASVELGKVKRNPQTKSLLLDTKSNLTKALLLGHSSDVAVVYDAATQQIVYTSSPISEYVTGVSPDSATIAQLGNYGIKNLCYARRLEEREGVLNTRNLLRDSPDLLKDSIIVRFRPDSDRNGAFLFEYDQTRPDTTRSLLDYQWSYGDALISAYYNIASQLGPAGKKVQYFITGSHGDSLAMYPGKERVGAYSLNVWRSMVSSKGNEYRVPQVYEGTIVYTRACQGGNRFPQYASETLFPNATVIVGQKEVSASRVKRNTSGIGAALEFHSDGEVIELPGKNKIIDKKD